jgi:hypothetical protein
MEGVGDRGRAGRLLAPLALILSQDLGLILGAQSPIPERELDLCAMMRPVRQSVVIADQFAVKLNRVLDRFAALPVIFTCSREIKS